MSFNFLSNLASVSRICDESRLFVRELYRLLGRLRLGFDFLSVQEQLYPILLLN